MWSEGSVTIAGLKEGEADAIQSALNGCQWVMVKDGRVQVHPAYEPLPEPTRDEEMTPFWEEFRPGKHSYQLRLLGKQPHEHSSPSIVIQSLCGYAYTPENYASESAKLESWGFVQLRSKRTETGQYHEAWILPGLWSARGSLKEAIEDESSQRDLREGLDDFLQRRLRGRRVRKPKRKLGRAVEFLRTRAQFGTLDVVSQRLAMVLRD